MATIAGSGGGAPETVVDGETGLVVRNREELVEAIVALHDNPDMREKIAAAGVDHVRQRWTWEVLGRRARRILAGAVD